MMGDVAIVHGAAKCRCGSVSSRTRRPHSQLGRRTSDEAYFPSRPVKLAV